MGNLEFRLCQRDCHATAALEAHHHASDRGALGAHVPDLPQHANRVRTRRVLQAQQRAAGVPGTERTDQPHRDLTDSVLQVRYVEGGRQWHTFFPFWRVCASARSSSCTTVRWPKATRHPTLPRGSSGWCWVS